MMMGRSAAWTKAPLTRYMLARDASSLVRISASGVAKVVGLSSVAVSLIIGFVLLVLHRHLGGPGDQLSYYQQAARLLPFDDNYYGPGYMVALRLVRDLLGVEWFTAGKLLSWLSACGFLLLSHRLLRTILAEPWNWVALTLIALNPLFISQAYSSLTIMFGGMLVLAAIVTSLEVRTFRPWLWLLVGVMFGLAMLTRFQAAGFLVGAVMGLLVVSRARIRSRVYCATALLLGAAAPLIGWHAFLLAAQGYTPANQNFVHLTTALGQFNSFYDVDPLVERYGSTLGVLTSSWSAPFRIAWFGLKQFVVSPVWIGVPLLSIGALLLVPGLLVLVLRRDLHAPWSGAFLFGLLLTGIGSMNWLHYYLPFLPFAVILIVLSLDGVGRLTTARVGYVLSAILICFTLVWSPFVVQSRFDAADWPEQTAAKEYLQRQQTADMLVTSTAGSFEYATDLPFVDQNLIMELEDGPWLVERLRQHGVTHLIITERHTLWDFPELRALLEDVPVNVPAGLQRDTLIVSPRRLAVYRVIGS